MPVEMKDLVEDIITSYETRIENIESIFNTTHELLQDFQKSFLDTKKERERISVKLRENLAKNESLRKKDFDKMMEDILSPQEERERQVRELLNKYITEQKEMVHTLRGNLATVKDSLAKGEARRVKEFQAFTKEVLAKQEARKEEVSSKLKEFQKEQQELTERLNEVFTKQKELRIKDFKEMLKEINARQKERRENVQDMLGGFKRERVEARKNWQEMQKKLAQKRACPSELVKEGRSGN